MPASPAVFDKLVGLPLDPNWNTHGTHGLECRIVQVRLERKALPASARPTCCSGREQRL